MIRFAMVMALYPTLAASQEAPVAWDCLSGDGRAFRVELWQPSQAGTPLHCVTGLDLEGVAGCAPQGGWGLSDPTDAPGELDGVTARSAETRDAEGKFFARVGPSEFVASASRGPGMPLALEVHGVTFWRLRMELLSGEGEMFTRDGAVAFRCGGIQSGP